jgi:hypothetical protein
MKSEFKKETLEKFFGCDSDELAAGDKNNQSIWLFGIEHGTFNTESKDINIDQNYSIETQSKWPYNVKAFKLLSVILGYSLNNYMDFANKYQPFVKGSKGFFKGNLYPYGFRSVSDFTEEVKRKTRFNTKEEYYEWCNKNRLPIINNWVEEYQPKIVIGVGITRRDDFSLAVFGKNVEFKEYFFTINEHTKKIYYFVDGSRKLIVIPHFAGRYGLNSNLSIEKTGKFIEKLINE